MDRPNRMSTLLCMDAGTISEGLKAAQTYANNVAAHARALGVNLSQPARPDVLRERQALMSAFTDSLFVDPGRDLVGESEALATSLAEEIATNARAHELALHIPRLVSEPTFPNELETIARAAEDVARGCRVVRASLSTRAVQYDPEASFGVYLSGSAITLDDVKSTAERWQIVVRAAYDLAGESYKPPRLVMTNMELTNVDLTRASGIPTRSDPGCTEPTAGDELDAQGTPGQRTATAPRTPATPVEPPSRS